MENWVPIFRPKLPNYSQLEKYITRIDSSRIYSNFGPLDDEVRLRFSEYLGLPAENIVTCANATLGIQGAISSSQSKGRWGLPAWTFSATAAALNQAKGSGVFFDVDENWRVDLDGSIPNMIDVLPFGQPVGGSRRYTDSAINNLVIDAAASIDACTNQVWHNFPSFAGILSFHATKVLPAGEGGLFFSNRTDWAERFRNWTRFGMENSRTSVNQGTNAKMSEYNAAVLLASMDNWPSDRFLWLEQLSRANDLAKKYGYSSSPQLSTLQATPYWIVEESDPARLDRLKTTFKENLIQTRNWWESGCHKMPAYDHFGREDLTNTDRIGVETLGLPFWIDMEELVWQRIEAAFQAADPM